MKIKGAKVLVTGGGGFVGSHLVEELVRQGAKVTCFVRYTSNNSWGFLDTVDPLLAKKVTIISGDLKDADSLREAMKGIDIVFHLAAMIAIPHSYDMPRDAVETNIIGTFNALVAARDAKVKRFIHTSTSEVYGSAQYVPINEQHPLQGQSPYSASKIGADKIAESFYSAYGLPVTIVRPFNTYGPRQSARAVIPTIITQVLTRDKLKLGNLKTTRDFLYVKDSVRAYIDCAESDKTIGQTINFGTGVEISIEELAKQIMQITKRKIPIIQEGQRLRPSKSEVMRLCADTKLAKQLLNWKPSYDLKSGLAETIDYIKDHLQEYKIDEYNK
jgi:NAD dependent epimerase/dehydratase